MATRHFSRSLLPQPTKAVIGSLFSRSFSSFSTPSISSSLSSPHSLSILRALRPLSAAASNISLSATRLATVRCLSTRPTSSSLNDPSPNWSNRPPKETILLDGCDFEHWLVVMDKPEGDPTRDEIIDYYIKTLAQVVGSEEEARMKLYSVSTRCYFAFGALVSEELSYKIKELPHVRWVLPDSYLDVKNKDYGGEPFINGKAVPYDPKYHEEWIRNNARANERNRRNDRPRNFDRSRNFERRRENMQQQVRSSTPMANQGMHNSQPSVGGMQQNNMSGQAGPQPNYSMGGSQNNMNGPVGPGGPLPPPNNYTGGMPYNSIGGIPQNSMGGNPQNSMGGMPQKNMGGMPQNNMAGMPPSAGWSNNMPGNMQQNFQNGPNNGGVPTQPSYQNNYTQNRDGSTG